MPSHLFNTVPAAGGGPGGGSDPVLAADLVDSRTQGEERDGQMDREREVCTSRRISAQMTEEVKVLRCSLKWEVFLVLSL